MIKTENPLAYLQSIIKSQKTGRPAGIMSVCSANRFVIEAVMRQALADDSTICIESTANQVNQFGGYTGMTPVKFAEFITQIADKMGFPRERIVLGGDHLGPGPWQSEPAEKALGHARELVRDCILAGYDKLHLDAGMACAGDMVKEKSILSPALAVQRTAVLCSAAEETAAVFSRDRSRPVYVIGTDVPVPGGMREEENLPPTSTVAEVRNTVSTTKNCFYTRHLNDAWERVVAIVVQPGIDFGPETVVPYNRDRTKSLISLVRKDHKFVFEAHSTDYQTRKALTEMVEDQFAILKVGPALTFAFREALTALSIIEEELLSGRRGVQLSRLRQAVNLAMTDNPSHWVKYHPKKNKFLSHEPYYSYSDRVRYYWNLPDVQASIQRLLKNLDNQKIPLPLISQYLPKEYDIICEGKIPAAPREIIYSRIMAITSRYAAACRAYKY